MNQESIWGRFIKKKKQRPKISCYFPFYASFWFPLKQTIVKIVFGWFLKHPELRKNYQVGELAEDCRELRNCGSQILKVRNRSSTTFLVRNSAIDLVVRNIAEVRTKIADAHLWKQWIDIDFVSDWIFSKGDHCQIQVIICTEFKWHIFGLQNSSRSWQKYQQTSNVSGPKIGQLLIN
jgi:hypothetical protein